MKARVKAIFTFDIYVNGEYSNEASYIKGNAMTFKQAIAEAKKHIRNFSANHVQIFLTAGSLAVADVTMFNREITVNDYNNEYTPSETYAVCWGVEYNEEEGESNAIAETTSKEDAKELAENESKDNNCRMCVVRKSDGKVIAIYDNTNPETPNNNPNTTTPSTSDTMNTETKAMNEVAPVEFSELSHAGQCTDIYLHNTAEIYERYTVEAVKLVVNAFTNQGPVKLDDATAWDNLKFWISWQPVTKKALTAAVRLVKKYDHMTPTAKDIEQVTRNYAAYIVECAKYEVENC